MSEQPEGSKKRKCGHVLEGPVSDRCQECNRISKIEAREKKTKLARNYMECPESLGMWIQNHVAFFPIPDTVVQPLYDTIQATRFAAGKEKGCVETKRPSRTRPSPYRIVQQGEPRRQKEDELSNYCGPVRMGVLAFWSMQKPSSTCP